MTTVVHAAIVETRETAPRREDGAVLVLPNIARASIVIVVEIVLTRLPLKVTPMMEPTDLVALGGAIVLVQEIGALAETRTSASGARRIGSLKKNVAAS